MSIFFAAHEDLKRHDITAMGASVDMVGNFDHLLGALSEKLLQWP
jgi:hypothetical protein